MEQSVTRPRLRPEPQKQLCGLTVSHLYRMPQDAHYAGGDYAETHRRADGSVTFVVGDLSAKGNEGSRLALRMRQTFRRAAGTSAAPSRIVAALNRALIDDLESRRTRDGFGSAFVATYEPNGTLRYAAAGVEPAILFRDARRHEHLQRTGPLTGLDREVLCGEVLLPLGPGDVLVAFTDGITESRFFADQGRQLGTHGLVEIVHSVSARRLVPTARDIMRELELWNAGLFRDDATLTLAIPMEGFSAR